MDLAFQLTPSRRATAERTTLFDCVVYFNSRPHGGRRSCAVASRSWIYFNSRPHGGRLRRKKRTLTVRHFNSRPHGGRQSPVNTPTRKSIISTHALTEGDDEMYDNSSESLYFNSRPHGGRLNQIKIWIFCPVFQLTPSRRATFRSCICYNADRHFNSRPHGGRQFSNIACHMANVFQLTPSRRATYQRQCSCTEPEISTHALTEGDGKFRQIFLLNRGYAYSISLYFLPHFISLLPQILSFQQKSFKFQVRIFLLFSVHLAFALQNQCVHHVKSRFCTNMFYFVFVLFTQIVKPQTIGLFIYDFF